MLEKMHKKWSRIRKGSFTYFFIIFFLSLYSPIVLFGTAYYNKLEKQIDQEVTQYHSEILENIGSDIDMRIDDLNTLAVKLTNSSWIRELTYMQNNKIDTKRVSVAEITSYVEELRTYEVLNPFVISLSILFLDKNYVISSHGVSSGNIFYNELLECQDFNYQDIISIAQNIYENETYFTENLSINTLRRNGPKMGEAIIYISPLNYNKFNKTMMIAYIPISSIEKVIRGRLESSPCCSVALHDKDEKELIHIASQDELWWKANELTYISPINGWKYKMNIPISTYNHAKLNIRIGVAIISLLALIIIALIAYHLSSHQVAPLKEMFRSLGHYSNDWINKQEIDYYQLKSLISNTVANEELLKQQNETLRHSIRNGILLKILYGISVDKEMQMVVIGENSLFYYNLYTLCLLVSEKSVDLDELKKDIDKSRQRVISYCLNVEDMITAIILNHDDDIDIDEWLEEIEQIVNENHINYYGTLFVGNTCNSIDKIHKSYRVARRLIDYRIENYERNSTICYCNELIDMSNIIYYPIHIEIRLINLLKESNIKTIVKVINDIVDQNRERMGLSLGNARFLAYNLIITAARAIESINQEYDCFAAFLRIETLEEVEAILDYVKDIYIDIIQIFDDHKNESDNELMKKIEQFMDQNYCMDNISLSMLAMHVGKPEYYVSRFIKKNFGENFLEYLHRMRMNKAKGLLDSGLKVHEVAKMTGYSNDITFRRTFKKYEGITPSEYKNVLLGHQTK